MTGSAAELVRHIVDRYHRGLRRDLAAIEVMLESEARDETIDALASTFGTLREELLSHLDKEESVLFPHIVELEEAVNGRGPVGAVLAGFTPGVVSVMMREHDGAELALVSLRRSSGDFTPPPGAGASRRELYERLAAMDEELRRHIALENDVLFPMALDYERKLPALR